MGIHRFVYAIGMFTGPWIGGVLADTVRTRATFASGASVHELYGGVHHAGAGRAEYHLVSATKPA
jgi:hypothetical protein